MDERDPERRGQVLGMTEPQTGPTRHRPSEGDAAIALPTDVQAFIGRQLRAVYNDVVNEPVPDRFVKLLEELERKKGGRA
jgi:hypothetical protein